MVTALLGRELLLVEGSNLCPGTFFNNGILPCCLLLMGNVTDMRRTGFTRHRKDIPSLKLSPLSNSLIYLEAGSACKPVRDASSWQKLPGGHRF